MPRTGECLAALLGLTLVLGAFAPACGRGGDEAGGRAPGPLRVVVSIPPLQGLVRVLTPEDARVDVVVRPGRSPHSFEPLPTDIAALARADLVVTVGLGIEASIPSRAIPGERTLVMADSLGIWGEAREEDLHAGEHVHDGGLDAHLWLDPVLVEQFVPALAERVREALRSAGAPSEQIDAVEARESELLDIVRSLDREYRERLAPEAGAAVITQHAAWSRLAGRYGLEIAGTIQGEESIEPSPTRIAELVEAAAAHQVRAVLTEPQLDRTVAARLAERLDLPLGVLDPLGSGDWVLMMRSNLDELVRVLGEGSPDH